MKYNPCPNCGSEPIVLDSTIGTPKMYCRECYMIAPESVWNRITIEPEPDPDVKYARVRAAVAIKDYSYQYQVAGWDGAKKHEVEECILDALESGDAQITWIEADIPIREPEPVKARVSSASTTDE